MNELIIALVIAGAFSILVLIYGLYSIITGKFGLTQKNSLKGICARRAGVILFLQFFFARAFTFPLNKLENDPDIVINPDIVIFLGIILYLLVALGGLFVAGDYARSIKFIDIYRIGKSHERQGNKAKAIEHYERFIDLKKDADPYIAARVEDAKKGLARLKE